jgi:fructose-1,6-bisphosphatase I
MTAYPALAGYLNTWSGADAGRRAVAATILSLGEAGVKIAALIAKGPLAGDMASVTGDAGGGDAQKQLDAITDKMVREALQASPVAWLGSEEDPDAVQLNAGAPLAVNVDPLDGSSNIDTNVSVGTIFSILPNDGPTPLLQAGSRQLAAGYIVYGPQTEMVLTVGEGTHIFFLDPDTKVFLLVRRNVVIPADTKEYAVNSSNFRHWDVGMKVYKNDAIAGKEGPRKKDFNMRWIASLVADTFRILTRGGVYIYPGDQRDGYRNGRLRLLYEANPIGMIIEQAGGACTTGRERMLDIVPSSLHQRVPLIFGSLNEVAEIDHQIQAPHNTGERSPLFGQRGLFRS